MTSITFVEVTPRKAAVAFALGAIFFGYAFVQRVSPSVMTDELMREFSVGGAALGSLSAFYFYAYASIQLPVGMLTDHFGPRKLMSFAAAFCAIGSVMFAMSDSIAMASLGRAFIGATVAFGFVGTMAIAGYWFKPAQYAMLAGLLQMVGMFGGVFGQAPLRQVVEAVGWRGTMFGLGGLALMLAILLFLLIPRRQTVLKKTQDGPSILAGLKKVANNRQTWLCATIGFGMAATMLAFGGLWGVPWLSSIRGLSTTEAAAITSMLFVGWAVFSPLSGWYSDRCGRRNLIMNVGAIVSLSGLCILFYATPDDRFWLSVLIFVVGAGGSAMTVCFSSVKELNHSGYNSTSLGLMNMCIVGSGAVMQPLIGWLLDLDWDGRILEGVPVYTASGYQTAFSSLIAVNLLALVAVLLLKETRCQQVYSAD
ncbi:MAG: MFS family permease [Gammaproteobacteria bacterium]